MRVNDANDLHARPGANDTSAANDDSQSARREQWCREARARILEARTKALDEIERYIREEKEWKAKQRLARKTARQRERRSQAVHG